MGAEQQISVEMLTREATFTRTIDEEARTVELAFSSEEPVERWFGIEILDHSPESVRLGRLEGGGAVLVDHDMRDHVGVVESVSIDSDRRGRAVVRFGKSARAMEIFQDVVDGIRKHVSVGYRIHKAVLEEAGDVDTYRVTDWEPYEISIVSVPADATVGVGRSDTDKNVLVIERRSEPEAKGDMQMSEANTAPPAAETPDLKVIEEQARKAEASRVADILAIGDAYGHADLAREFIAAGKGVDEFRAAVLERMGESKPLPEDHSIGMSDSEVRQFSFLRLIRAMATNDWADAGFEREVCEATAQKLGRQAKGALVPTDVLSRAVDTTVAGSTIQTDVLAQSFIELLRNRMKVRQLGATVLSGLNGNVSIPRQSGGATAYWVAEGAQPTPSDQAFDNVPMSPKGVAAETQFTTQTMLQSSIDIEGLIRMDLATVIALAIDLAAIAGTGTGNQPTGILNTTGIGSVAIGANGGALSDIDPLIDLEAAVANANADVDGMAYLTNTKVIAQLKKLKDANGQYLWSNSRYQDGQVGEINGYGVARSNQVPSNLTKGTGTNLSALLFGNWRDLLIGEWGALDLQVDPYTGGVGNIKVKALQFVDVAVRHPESFAAITDIQA